MAEIINLRTARKTKARAQTKVAADANRAKFGRTKAEKTRDAAEQARRETLLDGAKRHPE